MKLIVLTDLWGGDKFDWFRNYQEKLNRELVIYDSCELGNIDTAQYEATNLHQQFVNGGIEIAADKLLENEKEVIDVLAFSIGGTIAWKAILKGLKVRNLFAVSATRLRYETEKPTCHLHLFYGEKDVNRPNSIWFDDFGIRKEEIKNKGHELYKENEFSNIVVQQINNNDSITE